MRSPFHGKVLPPVFLAIHLIILLPAILPTSDPAHPSSPPLTLLSRLHPLYSAPLGILAFFIIHAVRLLASRSPLPQDRRRRALAARLEQALLFVLGVIEEVWRWGLVRLLVQLEGGKGGYAGSLNGFSLVLNEETPKDETPSKPEIWGGVYLMCWTWSLIESIYAWKSLRPPPESQRPTLPSRSGSERRANKSTAPNRPRSMGYGSFRNTPPKTDAGLISEGEASASSRTLKRVSDSSKSSSGIATTLFADLFTRVEPSSPPTAAEEGERRALSDNSSDGDDEDSDDDTPILSSRESINEAEGILATEDRPLLGSSSPPRPTQQPPSLSPEGNLRDSPLASPQGLGAPGQPSPRLVSNQSYQAPQPRLSIRRNSSQSTGPTSIFMLSLRTLHPLYPIVWRLTSLLTHVGYGLLYGWFPTLLLPVRGELRIEWWSVGLLVVIAAAKGASTVLWFGGTVARRGVGWISGLGFAAGLVTWLVSMGVWGVIGIPWDWND